tara:strand:- start:4645 stop:5715 length:1071 start_codon:yes stop_codon:yes gene_type:complete
MSEEIVPEYAGDRAAIGRAFTAAKAGLGKQGLLLRPIQRSHNELVYGIIRETPDAVDQRIEHQFEAVVRWSSEPHPEAVHGDHFVAHRVEAAYKSLRGVLTAEDWSGAITRFLEAQDAARVRSDGRIYWVPPQRVPAVRKFGEFLADIGIDLVLCEIEPAAQSVARGAARGSLDEQLAKLQSEVDAFDGKQRPSTYARRLEEFQRLRERALLYRDALGVGAEQAEVTLKDLEEKVSTMLELRTTTSMAAPVAMTPPEEVPLEPELASLQFAGAVFHYKANEDDAAVFVSDDHVAHSKIKMLEKIGVAGIWQSLGRSEVCIKNSGPPGARISIRVRTPEGGSIHDCATSLRTIGIEL